MSPNRPHVYRMCHIASFNFGVSSTSRETVVYAMLWIIPFFTCMENEKEKNERPSHGGDDDVKATKEKQIKDVLFSNYSYSQIIGGRLLSSFSGILF